MHNSDEDGVSNSKSSLETGFSVLDSQDLDKAELDVMKGNMIGDTGYSRTWVINTLISLSKVYEDEWSESLEKDLCDLWDITVEKDIVLFLSDNNFLQIAECILERSEEHKRLTEIILGIIGNMCCQLTVLETVGYNNNLVSLIFGFLSTDDSGILIQILRLLQSVAWNIQSNLHTKWLGHLKEYEFFGDALSFILQSSTNSELLIVAVDLLQSIAIIQTSSKSCLLTDLIKVDQLVPALMESFTQIIPERDITHSHSNMKFIENWLTIFSNVVQSKFETFASDKKGENITNIMHVLLTILQPYVHSSNLIPLEDQVALCIYTCVELISWLQRVDAFTNPKIASVIVTIMHELRLGMKTGSGMDQILDTDESKDLVKCLEKYWLETLQIYEEDELLEVIRMCEDTVSKCLMEVAEENSKGSSDAVAKLLRVKSLFLKSATYV